MTAHTRGAAPGALIFRKQLLPWSETFIAEQGKALRRYRPVFVGYSRDARGAAYLAGQSVALLEDHALVPAIGKAMVQRLGHVPGRWRARLAREAPAVVHAHFGVNALDADALARSFGVPLVVTYHGMDIAVERGAKAARDRARVFERAARVIAVSDFIAGKLHEAGCPAAKLVVHHIGVDTKHFVPAPFDAAARDVLFVGRLVEKKGLDHLLRAMQAVQRRLPGAGLIVAGDGPLRARHEALARELGVRVRFLGVRTPAQVQELMRSAALLGAPSIVAADGNAEGLPMTIVEALASGVPVVASPSGGSAEGVREGETGFVVPAGDEAALADRIERLLGDAALRRDFGAAARAFALAEFDLATQTARLEALYDAARGLRA